MILCCGVLYTRCCIYGWCPKRHLQMYQSDKIPQSKRGTCEQTLTLLFWGIFLFQLIYSCIVSGWFNGFTLCLMHSTICHVVCQYCSIYTIVTNDTLYLDSQRESVGRFPQISLILILKTCLLLFCPFLWMLLWILSYGMFHDLKFYVTAWG